MSLQIEGLGLSYGARSILQDLSAWLYPRVLSLSANLSINHRSPHSNENPLEKRFAGGSQYF